MCVRKGVVGGLVIVSWSASLVGQEMNDSLYKLLQVEQLHKIFKLCGSPSEEYWKKSKLPHATIFKPQQPYKRCLANTFKDFPASALALLDSLLAFEPEYRGSATLALQSEVKLSFWTINNLFYQFRKLFTPWNQEVNSFRLFLPYLQSFPLSGISWSCRCYIGSFYAYRQ